MRPTLNNAELIAAVQMVVEQNGMDRVLYALACTAYDNAKRPAPGSNTWDAVGDLLTRLSKAAAVKAVSPSTYEPRQGDGPVPHGPGWAE
jgi:hypothetical protein